MLNKAFCTPSSAVQLPDIAARNAVKMPMKKRLSQRRLSTRESLLRNACLSLTGQGVFSREKRNNRRDFTAATVAAQWEIPKLSLQSLTHAFAQRVNAD